MSLHITYKKKDMKNKEKCDIYVTVRNGRKMKCELKGTVNMNMKGEETFNLPKLIYVHQAVKNIFRVSRLPSKGSTMRDTQEKMTRKKNGVNMILEARKGKN